MVNCHDQKLAAQKENEDLKRQMAALLAAQATSRSGSSASVVAPIAVNVNVNR